MVITYLAKGDHDEKRLTSCGRPTLFARVALLDEHGKPVKQGEVGEICVSGPLLAGGYWNLPDETSRTLKTAGCTPATWPARTPMASTTSSTASRT